MIRQEDSQTGQSNSFFHLLEDQYLLNIPCSIAGTQRRICSADYKMPDFFSPLAANIIKRVGTVPG
jgi:hypothetical protein